MKNQNFVFGWTISVHEKDPCTVTRHGLEYHTNIARNIRVT
jgi:hypothetical protein